MLHHATKKRAADKGIILEQAPDGSDWTYRAFWPEGALELWGNDATKLTDAMIAARMGAKEYHLHFEQDTDDGSVTIFAGIKKRREVGKVEEVEDLPSTMPDVLEALGDGEADEIEEADAEDLEEEDKRGGSVVPDRYKKQYAEAGHPGTCGDWLATVLKDLTTDNKGKLDPDAVDEIARLNGLSLDKLTRTNPGWQGRYRMTMRNMLVKVVANTGELHVPATEDGDVLKAPGEWVAANQPKVKEPGNGKVRKA